MVSELPSPRAAARNPAIKEALHASIAALDSESWTQIIESGQFEVKLQPVVNLSDLSVTGFEGLIRWLHPLYGELVPAMFLPQLVAHGRAATLTQFILEKVAQFQVHALFQGLQTQPISVNVTGTEFQNGVVLLDTIKDLFQRHQLPKGCIALEMTETEWIENTAAAAFNIVNLRKLGVNVYADDFGHAYASLRYLLDFNYSGLKMDRSFVLAMTDDNRAVSLIRYTAQLAKEFKLSFVVEGIESEDQLTHLRELGVSHGQGYLFDRPLAMELAYQRLKPIQHDE